MTQYYYTSCLGELYSPACHIVEGLKIKVEIWSFTLQGWKAKLIVYKYTHSRKLANLTSKNHTTNIKKMGK